MSANPLNEAVVEEATLEWFQDLGYARLHGETIAPGAPRAERSSFEQVVLDGRLRAALRRINPDAPLEALEEAHRKLLGISSPSLVDANHELHHYLVNGLQTEFSKPDGGIGYALVFVLDFSNPDQNDWLVVNQFTIEEAGDTRRLDVAVFVNGMPLAIVELKNADDPKATTYAAYKQFQTYKAKQTALFVFNELLVASDGVSARLGNLSADYERFLPWRTMEGESIASKSENQLAVLLRGVFDKRRFLDMIRYFIVFESDGISTVKKNAGYHQFHAVARGIQATIAASRPDGDRRIGVVWHTTGSGKSLTMAFYAGRVILAPEMNTPTLVVITDRQDLDEQLFGTFCKCEDLLRQEPKRARDRADLHELLKVAAGGVIFTTIQKFLPKNTGDTFPELSPRHNIVVMADEAHRSQYDFVDGFARHLRQALPNASFIGFTGTPIATSDKNTRSVFGDFEGDYISVYDMQRSVEDGATVPIYYESRLAKLRLENSEIPRLDEAFEEITESEEQQAKEKLKSKWSALEALVGTERRVGLVTSDIVAHFEDRLRRMKGKAMIVCMSRRICVEMYDAIAKLRPDWHSDNDEQGRIKVIMTGSAADGPEWQPHIRNKAGREALARRVKNPDDELNIVIVRDMWLTGFDAPCMHTMYVDKPMHGQALIQAISRVNRVFGDKPGGLVVDYLGLREQLQSAVQTYNRTGRDATIELDHKAAIGPMLERYETCCDMFHGFDWSRWTSGKASHRMELLPAAQEHILGQPDGKTRFVQTVTELNKAVALAGGHDEVQRIADDVAFFTAIRTHITKTAASDFKVSGNLDRALRQIISQAVASDEVIDIFAAAGLKNPNISILSDHFMNEVREMPHKNLAVEVLRTLLSGEIKARENQNLVQARSFAEMLEKAVQRYQNRAIETIQSVDEMIAIATKLRDSDKRNSDLNLDVDELAFYDSLGVAESAVSALGDEELRAVARELVAVIRSNISIDWAVKDSVQAKLRLLVKGVLKKHGYPTDRTDAVASAVLKQAEQLSKKWSERPPPRA